MANLPFNKQIMARIDAYAASYHVAQLRKNSDTLLTAQQRLSTPIFKESQ